MKVLGSSHEILEFADKNIEDEDDRLYSSDPEKLQLEQSWGELYKLTCSSSSIRMFML